MRLRAKFELIREASPLPPLYHGTLGYIRRAYAYVTLQISTFLDLIPTRLRPVCAGLLLLRLQVYVYSHLPAMLDGALSFSDFALQAWVLQAWVLLRGALRIASILELFCDWALGYVFVFLLKLQALIPHRTFALNLTFYLAIFLRDFEMFVLSCTLDAPARYNIALRIADTAEWFCDQVFGRTFVSVFQLSSFVPLHALTLTLTLHLTVLLGDLEALILACALEAPTFYGILEQRLLERAYYLEAVPVWLQLTPALGFIVCQLPTWTLAWIFGLWSLIGILDFACGLAFMAGLSYLAAPYRLYFWACAFPYRERLPGPPRNHWLGFSPEADIDLSTSTDFEDLGCFLGDVAEFVQQDSALLGESAAWGLGGVGLGALALSFRKFKRG